MKKYVVAGLTAACILLTYCIWWGNTALMVTRYTVASPELPMSFDGFRIAQVSDLHNAEFGPGNRDLLSLLKEVEPDILVLTGDLVDSRRTDLPAALSFAREAVKIAPCYYVTGNHEARLEDVSVLLEGLEAAGVVVLRDESVLLERDGASITLLGMDEPMFHNDFLMWDPLVEAGKILDALVGEQDGFSVLLSHRPEWAELFREQDVDLILCGHTHGGQVRLPFAGGLIAPGQGFFPQYDAGWFEHGDQVMIISRGLGNSLIPVRINNRPEIVLTELYCMEEKP